MKRTVQFLLLAILLTGAVTGCVALAESKTIPEVTQSQFLTPPDDIRDFRYCEIIPVFRNRATLSVEIYNTFTLNE